MRPLRQGVAVPWWPLVSPCVLQGSSVLGHAFRAHVQELSKSHNKMDTVMKQYKTVADKVDDLRRIARVSRVAGDMVSLASDCSVIRTRDIMPCQGRAASR